MSAHGLLGIGEIVRVVRAKKQSCARCHARGEAREKLGLQNAMLVMAQLWPRIGKEDVDVAETDSGRQCLQKKPRFGLDEMEIAETGAVAFASRPPNPIRVLIDANADTGRVLLCIGRQEVAMAAAELPNDFAACRQLLAEQFRESVLPLSDDGGVFRCR